MTKLVNNTMSFLLFANIFIQFFILFLIFYRPFIEFVFIPIRPPLTHPDPREALIIITPSMGIDEDKNLRPAYFMAKEIMGGLLALHEIKLLSNRNQIKKLIEISRRIYKYQRRVDDLSRASEAAKKTLELDGLRMGRLLRWEQIEFIASNRDLFSLAHFEGQLWRDLLRQLKLSAHGP